MPEKQKKTIRELTLMLMYLTSWEERDTPEMRGSRKRNWKSIPLPADAGRAMITTCWTNFQRKG